MAVPEAPLEAMEGGLEPAGDGWFVVNAAEARWFRDEAFGPSCRFEDRGRPFPQVAHALRVLEPGKPNCMYHAEDVQEDFLVLQGECLLLVEGGSGGCGPGTSCTARRGPSTSSSAGRSRA